MVKIIDLYSGIVHKGKSLDSIIRRVYGHGAFIEKREGTWGSQRYDAWVIKRCDDKYARYDEPVAPIQIIGADQP